MMTKCGSVAPKQKVIKARSVGFARSCESFSAGEAPHAVRLWRAGWNATDKGDVNFTPRSAQLVMADYARRGNPLVFDYEHESLLPLEKRGGSPMRGVSSAPAAVPEIRKDANGAPELWARDIGWTDEAKRQITAGERRQISPVCDFDRETGEVLNLKNVALCREGATHAGTLLASVAKGTNMDELIQGICDAAAAMNWEKVEELCAQAEQAGNAGAAMMGRAMVKMAKPAAPPPAGPPPGGAPPPHQPPAAMSAGAYSADLAAMRAGVDEAKREVRAIRVENLIAASRDCFDAADEREHIAAADPEVTKRHIASVKRKLDVGTIAASRTVTEARPPKVAPGGDETFGLSVLEIQVAGMNGLSLSDYAASKKRTDEEKAQRRGKAS